MATSITTVLFVCCTALIFAVYMLVRNQQVYSYRRKLADTVFAASVWDYKWRLQVLNSASYNEMVLQFWKPLDSFYPDKSFLDLSNVRGYAPWEQSKEDRAQAAEMIQ